LKSKFLLSAPSRFDCFLCGRSTVGRNRRNLGLRHIGRGDAKLLAMLGAFLGIKAVPFIIFTSSLIGTVVGLTLMAVQRKDRYLAIPFGPYLAMGAVLYIFYGTWLINWYLRLGK